MFRVLGLGFRSTGLGVGLGFIGFLGLGFRAWGGGGGLGFRAYRV